MKYRLGSIEVDPANFLLSDNGQAVSVEPLVFDLIVYLIENRERVTTREELLDKIWAGRVVSDTTLSSHIKSARKALGDSGQAQQVIETVHGRGYRFVAEVEEVPADQGVSKGGEQPGRRARKRLALLALVVVALIGIGSASLLWRPHESIESIAVLPLKNLSNDPAQKYFVEGLQDALITRLSRTTELRVISKTSTLRYADTDKSIPEIARELNVDVLVEGSVLRDRDRVRITAQLVRGSADEQLWAKSYDRNLDYVLTLINDISLAIANEIEVAVKPQDVEAWAQRKPASVDVHELVLKGRHFFDRFQFNRSLEYYQEAVTIDPEFAPAHVGVGGSYLLMGFLGWAPDFEVIPKARESALRALDLDSNSPGGHSTLGVIQLYFDWDWESAQKNLLKALQLNPNDAMTRHAYADYLMVMGDLEGSLKQVEIGQLYDPFSPMARSVVDFHRLLVHRYDDVIDSWRQDVAADPDARPAAAYYAEALWLKGMLEEAYLAELDWRGRNEELRRAMETGYAESGFAGAMRHLAEALAGRETGYHDYVTLAKLYMRAEDPESALQWLEKAYEYRQPQILHIKAMPAFDELHSRPEFQSLIRRIGFPETPAQ